MKRLPERHGIPGEPGLFALENKKPTPPDGTPSDRSVRLNETATKIEGSGILFFVRLVFFDSPFPLLLRPASCSLSLSLSLSFFWNSIDLFGVPMMGLLAAFSSLVSGRKVSHPGSGPTVRGPGNSQPVTRNETHTKKTHTHTHRKRNPKRRKKTRKKSPLSKQERERERERETGMK